MKILRCVRYQNLFGLCLLVRNRHFDNDINQGLNDQMQPFNLNLTLGCFFILNI